MVVTRQQNAHKVAYIVKSYPEKSMKEVLALLPLPPLAANAAVWTAVELGLLELEGEGDKRVLKLVKEPEAWNFGENVEALEQDLTYAFKELAKKEIDLEDHYFGNWLLGYAPHDVDVATKHLLDMGILADYHVLDGENDYVFYTLAENRDKEWGRKQFKKEPIGTLEGDAPIIPDEEGNETDEPVNTVTTTEEKKDA